MMPPPNSATQGLKPSPDANPSSSLHLPSSLTSISISNSLPCLLLFFSIPFFYSLPPLFQFINPQPPVSTLPRHPPPPSAFIPYTRARVTFLLRPHSTVQSMAHLHLHHQLGKRSKELRHHLAFLDHALHRKSHVALLRLTILCALFTFTLLLTPLLLSCTDAAAATAEAPQELQPLLGLSCDRSDFRSDVCFMRGDVRTHSASGSILLVSQNLTAMEETIKPYTRKWETGAMDTVAELRLRTADDGRDHRCDVQHDVPAVVFSTGGYTGNVYHDFNDGLIPLFITSHQFDHKVVFVVLDYHQWWAAKYGAVLSRLSDHPPIDFAGDPRTHCFSEVIVGLRIHGELAVDPARMRNNATIADFRQVLDDAYGPRGGREGTAASTRPRRRPKLVIVQRNGSRAIENLGEAAAGAAAAGFRVEVLTPGASTALARIHRAMSTCDAMVGVHGAAMAHILFMRPGAAFIQIVPVGTDWPAAAYYGEPAVRMDLHYVAYRILARESTLCEEYAEDDAVLRDPDSVNAHGWAATKKVYLDRQKVRLDLVRFRRSLVEVRDYLISRRRTSNSKRQLRRPRQQQAKVWRKTTCN